MTDYFSAASQIAGQYSSIPNFQAVYFGTIQKESGWDPFAVGDNGQAIGFGQLHAGAAADTGVNRFDPISNLQGTAAYLAQQYNTFGNWPTALAAYNQGAGAIKNGVSSALSAGKNYANSVLANARKYVGDAGALLSGNPLPAIGDALGLVTGSGTGADSCGVNPICYLQQWIASSKFFERLAVATVALLLILGGLYLMKGKSL